MSLNEEVYHKPIGQLKFPDFDPDFIKKEVIIWTFTEIGKYKYNLFRDIFGLEQQEILNLMSEGIDYNKEIY